MATGQFSPPEEISKLMFIISIYGNFRDFFVKIVQIKYNFLGTESGIAVCDKRVAKWGGGDRGANGTTFFSLQDSSPNFSITHWYKYVLKIIIPNPK